LQERGIREIQREKEGGRIMEIRGIGSGSRMCKLAKNRKERKAINRKVGFLLHQRYER